MVTTLNVMPGLLSKSTTGITQFERPEEIISFLEVRADSDDLMKKIFYTDDAKLPQRLFNDSVIR